MGFLGQIFSGLSKKSDSDFTEKRRTDRTKMDIKVKIVSGLRNIETAKVIDVSPTGLYIATKTIPPKGSQLKLVFESVIPNDSPIEILAKVCRIISRPIEGIGVEWDRKHCNDDTIKRYRMMILHHMRHPQTTTQSTASGYLQVNCKNCGWSGSVSNRNLRCSNCGSSELA